MEHPTHILDYYSLAGPRTKNQEPILPSVIPHILKKVVVFFLEIRSILVLLVVSCSCIFTVYNGLYCFGMTFECVIIQLS
ncbi:hypothetical protein Hanom_Chr14g01272181 [Helianthus anomalus]